MKNNKGFVVSAILYPLLVLFLALVMGILAMSDTRKRILDKMKLEISDSIFDDAECSCDTILNKLNYLIKNGLGGGGGHGSYSYNVLGLNVKGYETEDDMPNTGNGIGDIAVITDVEVTSYYVSQTAPKDPKEGNIWIVQDKTSVYHIKSDYSNIGISYVMQYIEDKWVLKKSYVFDEGKWTLLYYVSLKDGIVDMTSSDVNAEIVHNFSYTGKYQPFTAVFAGYYKVELWGAQGGTATTSLGNGGRGAYTSGEIYLSAGETLYLYIGGTTSSTAGGWNGGGNGVSLNGTGRGGGGATDVRLVTGTTKEQWNNFESLKSRIMVAAGGAGGSNHDGSGWRHDGGPGGTLTGVTGSVGSSATIGTFVPTQSYGGIAVTTNNPGYPGGFGYGGNSQQNNWAGGGGGAGWYGGSGSSYAGSYTAGGSSYISGYNGCSSIEEESTSTNIIHNGNAYHYSGKYFLQPEMLANQNTGHGKAKITLSTVEILTEEVKGINEFNENYTFSGNVQVFNIKKSGTYKIELWGARGGSYGYGGGNGAYTSGTIYLNKNQTSKLYLYIGERPAIINGGWNGGGKGFIRNGNGSGGGGATDIRYVYSDNWKDFESLKSRIMVAAGGGGGANHDSSSWYGVGGAGGTINGNNGSGTRNANNYAGAISTQTMGGFALINNAPGGSGGFGYGGDSQQNDWAGGGGGGGYYGGVGTTYAAGVSGGGSSYISGYEKCSSIAEESGPTTILHTGNAYHFSGFYFSDTQMTAGVNSDTGRAKITYVSEENQTSLKNENNYYYTYAGKYQIFDAKANGVYAIELWGAQGGTGGGQRGGYGGYTYGEIALNVGEKFYIYVGQMPRGITYLNGGWNGGGSGTTINGTGSGGGGATDVRTKKTATLSSWSDISSLITRVMVAGGGGGGANHHSDGWFGVGGAGGGLNSSIGTGPSNATNYRGTVATQVQGGQPHSYSPGYAGTFGYGGDSQKSDWAGGGGGSGWYGGCGSSYAAGLDSGGSSYISGKEGCVGVDSSGIKLSASYTNISDSISNTGYRFANPQMIDGNGYAWTTSKAGTASGMPSPTSSSLITGNTGDGYAKITYLGD